MLGLPRAERIHDPRLVVATLTGEPLS